MQGIRLEVKNLGTRKKLVKEGCPEFINFRHFKP